MQLSDYDKLIKPHLHAIEAGAMMAAKHARAIKLRPEFETFAEVELAETRKTLQHALALIIFAQNEYRNKKVEA